MTESEKYRIRSAMNRVTNTIKVIILQNLQSSNDNASNDNAETIQFIEQKFKEINSRFAERPELLRSCVYGIRDAVKIFVQDGKRFTAADVADIFSDTIYKKTLEAVCSADAPDNSTVKDVIDYCFSRILDSAGSAEKMPEFTKESRTVLEKHLTTLITDPIMHGDAAHLERSLEYTVSEIKKIIAQNSTENENSNIIQISDKTAEDIISRSYIRGAVVEVRLSEEDTEYIESAAAVVNKFFADLHWVEDSEYEVRTMPQTGDRIFELRYSVENSCILRLSVCIGINPRLCTVTALLPVSANKYRILAICKEIAAFNRDLSIGALHCDEETGRIYYKYTFPVADGIVPADFDYIFRAVVASSRDCFDSIRKCCIGRFSREKADRIRLDIEDLIKSFELKGE